MNTQFSPHTSIDPEVGFYYHYKHDPHGVVQNYAYEVIGVGTHTETEEKLVVYRSLYQTEMQDGVHYWIRPRDMFVERVTKDGRIFPRFQKITDAGIVEKLKQIKNEMYGNM